MVHHLTAQEALVRVFSGHHSEMDDAKMAERTIAWLEQCGYQIVEKDQVTLAPPEPVDDGQQQIPEFRYNPPARGWRG